jgi:carbon storage regulator CsrA
MLILTRKEKQTIELRTPDLITATITIIQSRDGRCRIGIEAPPSIHVRRGELPESAKQRPVERSGSQPNEQAGPHE